ncbi:cupin domain-containing protein [Streptomyces sp. IB201691-2A2]|uniref:cupin domain-containing protein n=1 Tax=Streptomyces sp. IB201691-2A2 TaxID=2561920 RepID=UPI00117E7821|nr:cupin domain-containing protein [Streptomyces sp. IB201691-2A2]TRO57346.1 cupin domain-containing protein [Streptomyces sp. IB201691-2A2]
MSIPYLAQREDQQQLEWIGGSVFSVLLDAEATGGQLTVGRFDVSKGEAPPFHVHNNEDEVFLLLSGSALVWADDEEHELREGGIVFLPRRIPHGYRITSEKADLLLISTPGGLEKMFRHAGRDLREPRPEGFEIPAQLLAEAAELSGNVVLGPPR